MITKAKMLHAVMVAWMVIMWIVLPLFALGFIGYALVSGGIGP